MRILAVLMLALVALLVLPCIVGAEDYPLLSAERLSVAGAVNYGAISAAVKGAEPLVGTHDEFFVGFFPAYNLTHPDSTRKHLPHTSLAGSVQYGLTSKRVVGYVGFRWLFYGGN